jgi:pyridoxamine 5'-phosphate oxidase
MLSPDPARQFAAWLQDAIDAGVAEPNAFVLSTVGRNGAPSSRTVLLNGFDPPGLVFFTNYLSRKADDLEFEPRASALFLWLPLHRQLRIEGTVEKIDPVASDEYFASRPPESRLASAVSPQSQVISEEQLEGLLMDMRRKYPDGEVPRPDHWGGYRLLPSYYEFWQGREARLHDRFRYVRSESGWQIDRLAP